MLIHTNDQQSDTLSFLESVPVLDCYRPFFLTIWVNVTRIYICVISFGVVYHPRT